MQRGVRSQHGNRARLLNQGDSGGWVLLCLSGRSKVVYAEPDGRELVVAIRGPGDVLGEFSGGDGLPRSCTVQAIEPGLTSKLSDQRFADVVQRFGIRPQLDNYIMGKVRESAAHAWQLAHRTTPARLADLLGTIIRAAGPDHRCAATIAMSQEEMASALGLARSAITPVLASWKAAGLIEVSRGKLRVVDLAALPDHIVSTAGQNAP